MIYVKFRMSILKQHYGVVMFIDLDLAIRRAVVFIFCLSHMLRTPLGLISSPYSVFILLATFLLAEMGIGE